MFNYSNIYINTCTEFYQSLDDKEIILDYNLSNQNFDIIDFQDNSTINNFDDNLSIINLGNRRVLIFVMESVTYDDFIKNQNKYFLGKVRNNSHIYSNYYTTNQDSLTSIFTILTSNFIPYDAYTNNWEDLYGKKIASSLSLIDIFNQNNFYTSFFVSTYTKVGFLEFFNWTDSNYLINKENNYLCLTIFGNENGCEDRAILDDVENKIKLNKNLFLFQELIFGHGIKYNQVLKETNMEYYNSYLLDIYNFLEKENLLENTTIILVSDHGLRNVKNDESPNKYKIPLIIYNDKFNFSNNDNLFNHIDFKQILFHELYNTKLKPRNEIYYIGQTRTSIVGYLNTNNQSFTIKNNEDNILQIQSSNISDKLVNEKIYTFLKYKYKFNY